MKQSHRIRLQAAERASQKPGQRPNLAHLLPVVVADSGSTEADKLRALGHVPLTFEQRAEQMV